MTEIETFILGMVMVSTMDPMRDDDTDFDVWRVFWDVAMPTWNRAAREHAWRFESSLLWNPA